jgi:hypothetical protein
MHPIDYLSKHLWYKLTLIFIIFIPCVIAPLLYYYVRRRADKRKKKFDDSIKRVRGSIYGDEIYINEFIRDIDETREYLKNYLINAD